MSKNRKNGVMDDYSDSKGTFWHKHDRETLGFDDVQEIMSLVKNYNFDEKELIEFRFEGRDIKRAQREMEKCRRI